MVSLKINAIILNASESFGLVYSIKCCVYIQRWMDVISRAIITSDVVEGDPVDRNLIMIDRGIETESKSKQALTDRKLICET